MNLKKIILILFFILSCFSLAENIDINKNDLKKKIVFVKDDNGDFFNAVEKLIKDLVYKKGWTELNSEYIVLSIEGIEEKKKEIIDKIKEIKPDVVLINTTLIEGIGLKLEKEKIPFVAGGGLEMEDKEGKYILVDEKGYPAKNITGTYTMPREHMKNSFILLNKIIPLKDKKVVFATYPTAAFSHKKVKSALNDIGIELKDYQEFLYFEDYQEFVIKYNEDNEVGWIVSGEMMSRKKDNTCFSFEEFFKWERENNKKPNLGYWGNAVEYGKMSALAIDSMTTVNQMIDMADRILKGENLSKVKPEDPKRTLIMINLKTAQNIGVEIPLEILGAAWRVYTDYEGNYIGKFFETEN